MFNPHSPATTVIALHCSGASGRQWQRLDEHLFPGARFIAPDLIGYGQNPCFDSRARVTLAEEAAPIVAMIDQAPGQVHLVGHSYGGAVALRATLERPDSVASLTIYDPSAFSLLRYMRSVGAGALREIETLIATIDDLLAKGKSEQAMREFYDYWQEVGAWKALDPDVKASLTRRIWKVPADFAALMGDDVHPRQLRRLTMPVMVLTGEKSPNPSRLIAEYLARVTPRGHILEAPAAGHMGPFTRREWVASIISNNILNVALDQAQTIARAA
jgi:pimeloyl-ACP methyl ester carboxylesterase